MKVIYTTNDDVFKSIGSPKLCDHTMRNVWYPTNLVFSKTYYTEKDGCMVAFKVLAMAIVNRAWQRTHCVDYHKGSVENMAYFVHYANMPSPIWELHTLKYHCFESMKDYMAHSTTIRLKIVELNKITLDSLIDDESFDFSNSNIFIRKTYVWLNSYNLPYRHISLIESVVFTNEGMVVCLKHKFSTSKEHINGFGTSEECINDHLNNMKLIDFGGGQHIISSQ